MQPSLTGSVQPAQLSERQRRALISLLADEDPDVYRTIRAKLLSYGATAEQWLRPETLSADPLLRRRAKDILHSRARECSHERFLEFCRGAGEELDLEAGVFLLSATRHPEINPSAYIALLDMWGADIASRTARLAADEARLGELNRFVFGELRFDGSLLYSQEPDCCYLSSIIDKRVGNPIGLCAIHLFLARRAALPICGINMPGHFLCRYQTARSEIYLDCFQRGAFRSRADCIRQLQQMNHPAPEVHFTPATPRQILLRMCRNVVTTYGHLESGDEAGRAAQYVEALAR